VALKEQHLDPVGTIAQNDDGRSFAVDGRFRHGLSMALWVNLKTRRQL
jgi:hypothetical protein